MEAVIEKKNETTVAEIVNKQNAPGRITVVTPDNFDAYANEKLNIKNPDPAETAKEEKAKLEAEKKTKEDKEKAAKKDEGADVEGEEGVTEHLPKDKKGKLNERFSKITADRKAAEERAAKAEATAKEAREAREQAEADARALREKYEPVKTEPDPEPQPSQFTDTGEYAKALKEWQADQTRREEAQKAEDARTAAEQARVAKEWQERQTAFRKETPDYDKIISESAVKVSDQVRDAILESEVGPQILHHLAVHPEDADRIGKLTVSQALTQIGRLETRFLKGGEQKTEAKTTVAEISKAPAPISPIKSTGTPVEVVTSGTQEWHGTFEEYKAKRLAGKIR